ncbi:MAG: OB-fold nucleic acid binding domain-containing protein, partial [bacterium]
TLFNEEEEITSLAPSHFREYSLRHKMEIELELLGFTVSAHPLDYYNGKIDWHKYIRIADLFQHLDRPVRICGIIIERRRTKTIKGEYMKFLSVADRSGIVETVLFPSIYQQYGHLTTENTVLEFHGTVDPFENRNGLVLSIRSIKYAMNSETIHRTEPFNNPEKETFLIAQRAE